MPKLHWLISFGFYSSLMTAFFASLVDENLAFFCQQTGILLLLHYKCGAGTTVTCDRGLEIVIRGSLREKTGHRRDSPSAGLLRRGAP
jgi:hypothetical protein